MHVLDEEVKQAADCTKGAYLEKAWKVAIRRLRRKGVEAWEMPEERKERLWELVKRRVRARIGEDFQDAVDAIDAGMNRYSVSTFLAGAGIAGVDAADELLAETESADLKGTNRYEGRKHDES